MKEYTPVFIIGLITIAAIAFSVEAKEPTRYSCECKELRAIRLLLQHQFNMICDELHCEGSSSSSSNGSSLP